MDWGVSVTLDPAKVVDGAAKAEQAMRALDATAKRTKGTFQEFAKGTTFSEFREKADKAFGKDTQTLIDNLVTSANDLARGGKEAAGGIDQVGTAADKTKPKLQSLVEGMKGIISGANQISVRMVAAGAAFGAFAGMASRGIAIASQKIEEGFKKIWEVSSVDPRLKAALGDQAYFFNKDTDPMARQIALLTGEKAMRGGEVGSLSREEEYYARNMNISSMSGSKDDDFLRPESAEERANRIRIAEIDREIATLQARQLEQKLGTPAKDVVAEFNPEAARKADLQGKIDTLNAAIKAGIPGADVYQKTLAKLTEELENPPEIDLAGLTTSVGDGGAAAREAEAALKALRGEFTALEVSLDPVTAATAEYEDKLALVHAAQRDLGVEEEYAVELKEKLAAVYKDRLNPELAAHTKLVEAAIAAQAKEAERAEQKERDDLTSKVDRMVEDRVEANRRAAEGAAELERNLKASAIQGMKLHETLVDGLTGAEVSMRSFGRNTFKMLTDLGLKMLELKLLMSIFGAPGSPGMSGTGKLLFGALGFSAQHGLDAVVDGPGGTDRIPVVGHVTRGERLIVQTNQQQRDAAQSRVAPSIEVRPVVIVGDRFQVEAMRGSEGAAVVRMHMDDYIGTYRRKLGMG